MTAREQRERRHAGLVEARRIGRQVRVVLQLQVEARHHVDLFEQRAPRRARADGLHRQLVVAHPSDHVEVHIGGDVRERHGGRRDEGARPEQAHLFTRPERHDDATLPLAARQLPRGLEHRRHARRVVVGAEVGLVGLVAARERTAAAATSEVIVVGAYRDHRLRQRDAGRRRQVADDVVRRGRLANDLGRERHAHALQREAGDVRVARVELRLHVVERLRVAREEAGRHVGADAGRGDARPRARRVVGERHGRARVRRPRARDDEQALCPALARHERLVAQARVAGERRPQIGVGILREVAQDDDDLVLDVERGVAVVAEAGTFRHGQAVAGEDDLAADFRVVGERQALHVGRGVEPLGGIPARDRHRRPVVAHARRVLERQEEVVTTRQRRGAHRAQLPDEVRRRRVGSGRARGASLESGRGEVLDVRTRRRGRVGGGRLRPGRAERQRHERRTGGHGSEAAAHRAVRVDVTGQDVRACRELHAHRPLPRLGGAASSASSAFSWFHAAK